MSKQKASNAKQAPKKGTLVRLSDELVEVFREVVALERALGSPKASMLSIGDSLLLPLLKRRRHAQQTKLGKKAAAQRPLAGGDDKEPASQE